MLWQPAPAPAPASRGSPLMALRGLMCACMLVTTILTAFAWLASVGSRIHQEWRLTARNADLLDLLNKFPQELNVSFEQHSLNVQVSHHLPLDREIPDSRPQVCKNLHYKLGELPRVSIIMPIYDESWSMLLRSLHSVVDRTPARLLKEILLVDDHSSYSYLGDALQEYCSTLSPIIRILRSNKREGLIRARMRAAREARGEVLVFLDAHIECNQDWLPPLLDMLIKHPNTIAIPHIDSIDPNTITYDPWNYVVNGGFTWGMEYVWKIVPEYISSKLLSPAQPYPTPTTIGCAMAVRRNYFFHLGGFDEGMFIWGGENLEISFRTWMCGGSLFIVPCSHVGHLFRTVLPYAFPYKYGGGKVRQRNYQRVAEVWMDEYKSLFYATTQMRVPMSVNETISLQQRQKLRKFLNCKSFTWYLENVIPEMPIPRQNDLYFGQLKNLDNEYCMTTQKGGNLSMSLCGRQSLDQHFSLTADYHIIAYNTTDCLTAKPDDRTVILTSCNASDQAQLWDFLTKIPAELSRIIPPSEVTKHPGMVLVSVQNVRLSLDLVNNNGTSALGLTPKYDNKPISISQYWYFTSKLNFTIQ